MFKLKQDSRDAKFNLHFGQVSKFEPEKNFDTPFTDKIQPPGNVECTCYTCCKIGLDKDKVYYNPDELFQRVPHGKDGAQARDALNETVKNGLLPENGSNLIKTFSSYWRGDSGDMDAFDNVRSAMTMAGLPIACWTAWYYEWMGIDILPEGKNVATYHMYAIEGWKIINGETYLIIEAWIGMKLYMSRNVFNKAVAGYGCGTAVLSTFEIDGRRTKTLKEKMADLMVNALLACQALLRILMNKQKELQVITPPAEPTKPVVESKPVDLAVVAGGPDLKDFCIAIRDYEGKPGDLNYQNNNPGNCVYSTVGYDPKYGKVKKRGRFAVFPTPELGMLYLENLVKEKIAEHPDWSIYDYFALSHAPKEDGNNPKLYASWVAHKIGISTTTKLKSLLI